MIREEDAGRYYSTLSNEELQRLLWRKSPSIFPFRVTDEVRQTAIAMLMFEHADGIDDPKGQGY
jgi:hypothetical protein